jgi:hypothetical protein
MKNIQIKSMFALFGILLFSGSCANLDESPDGLLTPETFYQTTQDLNAATVAAYRPFMEFYLNAQGGIPTMGGDDVTSREGSNKLPYRSFDKFTPSPNFQWLLQHNWEPLFKTIFYANAVINNFENVEESFSRDAIAAEAYFLRGWAYFQLVRTFGPVPIVTGNASGDEPRSPEEEVYELIISDLTWAEDRLPASWFGEPGRATKWACKSLLAKVYITTAGWPLKRTGNYALAAGKAQEVLDGSTHRLLDDFSELWNPNNPNNKESVLAVQACENCGDWGLSNRMPYSIAAEAEEGGWDDYYAEISFFEDYPDGPRKDATFQTTFSGNVSWENTSQKHPYYSKTRGYETAKISSLNEYVIRFADVVLLFAEAQNKATGADAAAYEALNSIRRRAAGLDPDIPDSSVDLSGLSPDAFHDAVLDERAWELCAEWERWFDMVRNQIVARATSDRAFSQELELNGAVDVNSEASFEPFYYAPIPQNEILLRPDWQQNPCCN